MELAKQLAGLPEDPTATETVEWPPRWVLDTTACLDHCITITLEDQFDSTID